ncbi:MAG: cell division protein ZapA [Clostridia bacterium]|nr:cell division protein ZapA [Clostridia bacterium]
MAEKNTLIAKINGRDYTLASTESREYMLSIADLVDRKMKQVQATSSHLNTTHIAVLTALNLADDYMRIKRTEEALSENVRVYAEKIKNLEAQLEKLKRPYR